MPTEGKHTLKKLRDTEVNALRGKLMEVRRIGAHPIFISVARADTVELALEKADIPTDGEIKVEALKPNSRKWEAVDLDVKVFDFDKLAVTTRVNGA